MELRCTATMAMPRQRTERTPGASSAQVWVPANPCPGARARTLTAPRPELARGRAQRYTCARAPGCLRQRTQVPAPVQFARPATQVLTGERTPVPLRAQACEPHGRTQWAACAQPTAIVRTRMNMGARSPAPASGSKNPATWPLPPDFAAGAHESPRMRPTPGMISLPESWRGGAT
jgi:hypothetical protein